MTPKQARAARAMLGLDMKEVCRRAEVSERTLSEFEAGRRAVNNVTEAKIKAFYIASGISFTEPPTEAVSFIGQSTLLLADEPGAEMREFLDIVGVDTLKAKVSVIDEVVHQLTERPTASQLMLKHILSRSGHTQKELAGDLECTAAFINAIFVGKKAIPAQLAQKLQQLLPGLGFDVAETLLQDKVMRKLNGQLAECVRAYRVALQTVVSASSARHAGESRQRPTH